MKIFTCFHIYGENFYPDKIEEKLKIKFNKKNNPNHIGKNGRIISYGQAYLDYEGVNSPSSEYLEEVYRIAEVAKYFEVNVMELYMAVGYMGESKQLFKSDFIRKLGELNIFLIISTYEND